MGTRSLTRFIETYEHKYKNGKKKIVSKPITCVYRQYDGYPDGHGKELADFLNSGEMVNGIGSTDKRVFNGLGCLAAQFIKEFKDGAGNIYIHEPDSKDCWEQYVYEVIYNFDTKELKLTCYDVYDKRFLFEGNPKEFYTILQTA